MFHRHNRDTRRLAYCTGFPMPRLGFPLPDWCSAPRRFCSLSRSEHSDLLTEHNLSKKHLSKTQYASPIHVELSFVSGLEQLCRLGTVWESGRGQLERKGRS
jgi:hypothetical protein